MFSVLPKLGPGCKAVVAKQPETRGPWSFSETTPAWDQTPKRPCATCAKFERSGSVLDPRSISHPVRNMHHGAGSNFQSRLTSNLCPFELRQLVEEGFRGMLYCMISQYLATKILLPVVVVGEVA